MTRHFLRDDDLSPAEQQEVLGLAATLKRAPYDSQSLAGPRTVAIIFDKPTLRTQASFAAGIAELGGYPMMIDGSLAGIGKRESVADIARVLGRQASVIVWRTYAQTAPRGDGGVRRRPGRQRAHRRVPPLPAAGRPAHDPRAQGRAGRPRPSPSSATAPATWATPGCSPGRPPGMHVRIAAPEGLPARAAVRRPRRGDRRGDRRLGRGDGRPTAGRHRGRRRRHRHLGLDGQGGGGRSPCWRRSAPTRSPATLLALAVADAIVLHCLPAYRGKEIDADVLDGPQSVVWDEAENRRHAQKAILTWLLQASATSPTRSDRDGTRSGPPPRARATS